MANRQFSSLVKKLYDLPTYVNNILKVPLLDTPMVALQLPGSAIKDSLDQRSNLTLCKAHEAIAMSIRATTTTSLVSKVAIERSHKIFQLLSEDNCHLHKGTAQLLKGSAFSADATLDAVTISTRAMALAVVARHLLWLRAWPTNYHFKTTVVAYPFQGDKEKHDRTLLAIQHLINIHTIELVPESEIVSSIYSIVWEELVKAERRIEVPVTKEMSGQLCLYP
uniref:Uncharacterized protein n=1 Tax=Sphaerodactylus townsendi TaxID=933632 RepID=A0ACB8F8C5_9SAUR